jgi:hypothetical protein
MRPGMTSRQTGKLGGLRLRSEPKKVIDIFDSVLFLYTGIL